MTLLLWQQSTIVSESLALLELENLHAEIDGKPILKGLSLTVNAGEAPPIVGPTGADTSILGGAGRRR